MLKNHPHLGSSLPFLSHKVVVPDYLYIQSLQPQFLERVPQPRDSWICRQPCNKNILYERIWTWGANYIYCSGRNNVKYQTLNEYQLPKDEWFHDGIHHVWLVAAADEVNYRKNKCEQHPSRGVRLIKYIGVYLDKCKVTSFNLFWIRNIWKYLMDGQCYSVPQRSTLAPNTSSCGI